MGNLASSLVSTLGGIVTTQMQTDSNQKANNKNIALQREINQKNSLSSQVAQMRSQNLNPLASTLQPATASAPQVQSEMSGVDPSATFGNIANALSNMSQTSANVGKIELDMEKQRIEISQYRDQLRAQLENVIADTVQKGAQTANTKVDTEKKTQEIKNLVNDLYLSNNKFEFDQIVQTTQLELQKLGIDNAKEIAYMMAQNARTIKAMDLKFSREDLEFRKKLSEYQREQFDKSNVKDWWKNVQEHKRDSTAIENNMNLGIWSNMNGSAGTALDGFFETYDRYTGRGASKDAKQKLMLKSARKAGEAKGEAKTYLKEKAKAKKTTKNSFKKVGKK